MSTENKVDLSQSSCSDDSETGKSCDFKVTCCSEDVCPEESGQVCDKSKCPGEVCQIPKKSRKMRPPNASRGPPLNQLFSQLFSSVLGGDGDGLPGQGSPNPMAALGNMMRQNTRMRDEDEDSDQEEDEGESSSDEDDGNHDCHVDHRWDTIDKLIESHVNLTRAVSDLIRKV
jgi:hypothetical protein